MLLAARHLVNRVRHVRSRADEVLAVRRRLAAQAAPAGDNEGDSDEELRLARELLRLREELSAALAGVRSCSGCARGHSLPHGRWNGGQCCGGRTEDIFTDDELRALRLSGTTAARLAPPRSNHAGCAFRGPEGCSLAVADRPNLCVRYVCRELEGELTSDGKMTRVRALAGELARTFTLFAQARSG